MRLFQGHASGLVSKPPANGFEGQETFPTAGYPSYFHHQYVHDHEIDHGPQSWFLDKGHEIFDVVLIRATRLPIVDVRKPLRLRRHVGQTLKFARGQGSASADCDR